MESRFDFQTSKSDVNTISRRSSRIRNATSPNKQGVNKNCSNPRSQVNTNENEEIVSEEPKNDQVVRGSVEDSTSDEFKTVSSLLLSSIHEKKMAKKNNCAVNSSTLSDSVLQPEDVSNVFKLSKTVSSSITQQSDLKSGKLVLRTYCKQLKFLQNSQDIESFGLPDNPLISQNTSLTPKIDIEGIDASEITLSDVKFTDEPWEFTHLNEDYTLLNLKEIRFKEHPQKLLIFGNFPENLKDQDLDENEYVFTSTPKKKTIEGSKKHKSVNIDLMKRNLKEAFNDHITLCKSNGNQKVKNNLVLYDSLNHGNEEVEIFNTSRTRTSPVLPIINHHSHKKQNKFDLNNDTSSNNQGLLDSKLTKNKDDIEKEWYHTSRGKKLLSNIDIGLEIKPEEPIEVSRRVLRSSSLDISQENIRNKSPAKQNFSSSRRKWLSVSQDDINSKMKNDGIKKQLLNKSFPQLKVVLSPINTFHDMKILIETNNSQSEQINSDTLHSETGDAKTNSTRKSLRSYKVLGKPDIEDPNSDNFFKLSGHSNASHCISIQSMRIPKCSEIAMKSAPQPQIFDDNSSSLDNILNIKEDMNSKDDMKHIEHQSDEVSTPCEKFQGFLNHIELKLKNGLKNDHIGLKQIMLEKATNYFPTEGDIIAQDERFIETIRNENPTVEKNVSLNQNQQSNSEITDADDASSKRQVSENCLENSKVPDAILTAEYSSTNNGKSYLNVPESYDSNNDSQVKIHKTSSTNSEKSFEKKRIKVVDNIHLNEDELEKVNLSTEYVQDGVLKVISTPQKRGRGRPRKHFCSNKNSIYPKNSNSDSTVEYKGDEFHIKKKYEKQDHSDIKENYKSSQIILTSPHGKLTEKKPVDETAADMETELCTQQSSAAARRIGTPRKSRKISSENLLNESPIKSSKSIEKSNSRKDNGKNMKEISAEVDDDFITFTNTGTKLNNDSSFRTHRKRGRPRKKVPVESDKPVQIMFPLKNDVFKPHRKRGRPRKVRIDECVDYKPLFSARNDVTINKLARNSSQTKDSSIVGQSFTSSDGTEEMVSETEVLESAQNSQNTIADLVKKRSRSPKNYKLSRSRSLGKKSEKYEDSSENISSVNYETLTNISIQPEEKEQKNLYDIRNEQTNHGILDSQGISKICEELDDSKENEKGVKDNIIKENKLIQQEYNKKQNKLEIEIIKKNTESTEDKEKHIKILSETIMQKQLVNGWKKINNGRRNHDKKHEIQCERKQNIHKESVIVSKELDIKETINEKEADREQKHEQSKFESSDKKNLSYKKDIFGKKETTNKRINSGYPFSKEQANHSNITRDVMQHFGGKLSNEEYFNKEKEKTENAANNESIKQTKVKNHNITLKCTKKYRINEFFDEEIADTSKITDNHMDDECPNYLERADDIDDGDIKDIKVRSKLVTSEYSGEECPYILERTKFIENEDIKDDCLKQVLESENGEGHQVAEKNYYGTEFKYETSHKHILRSKTSLGNRMKQNIRDDTSKQIMKSRRSSLEHTDDDNMEELIGCKNSEISLRSSKKVKLPHPEIIRDVRGNPLKFSVGSIAWAKIGSFPFWPCLVTEEPDTEVYVKNMFTIRALPRMCYHVIFFGDKGRRAWISRNKMMVYKNKEDLHEICNKLKNENKPCKEIQEYSVRANYLKKWLPAVEEAENVMLKPPKERPSFFESYLIAKNEDVEIKVEGSPSRKRSRSSKMQDSDLNCSLLKIQDSPIKKKLKKAEFQTPLGVNGHNKIGEMQTEQGDSKKFNEHLEPDLQKGTSKLESVETPTTRIKECTAKMKQRVSSKSQTPNDPIPSTSAASPTELKSSPNNNDKYCKLSPPKHEFKKNADALKEEPGIVTAPQEDSVTIIDRELNTECVELEKSGELEIASGEASEAESHNLSTFFCESIEAQNALFKRSNLFKGVLKEKVCQYCFISGDVLKCKGCNAVYHAGCSIRVLQELMISRRRNRTSFLKEGSFVDDSKVKVEVKDKELNHKENKLDSDDEDHVQIITVPSSVYNTPPRKTFPPNFENLSLAEQIDFKMSEVMKKFETKTTYAESSTDTSSEDCSAVQLPTRRSFSRVHNLFPPISKTKSNSLDNVQVFSKPTEIGSGIKPTKSVRHVTADISLEQTVLELEDLLDKPGSSMMHVTADSLSTCDRATKDLKNKADKSQKLGTKHVTADCASFETVDSENSNSNFSHQTKQSEVSETTDSVKSINPKNFKCGFCTEQMDPYCFVCHQAVSKKGSSIRHKCSLYQCSRFYHSECLKLWPQTQWSLIQTTKHRYSQEEIDSFVCPQHVCHTCVSDDPRAATSRCSGDKIVKCQRCPSTYHSTSLCVPAGTDILSSTQIVCPRHRDKSKMYTINTTWCFLCSEGGALICCETCPTSVHPECMPHVNLNEDEKFICEDCESGRLPLYDEIVWVKLGKYRWWPGLVLFPSEIPLKVMNMKHNVGEFVVKFFGTYDHYWVNRGRSFLFQEGDAGDTKVTIKKKVEQATYKRAVDEAVVVHKLKKEFKLKMEVESLNSQKPPPYIKIKVNKPVGNVRLMELDLSNTTACECNPKKPNPCGPESDCLNRLLLTECNPEACPAGKSCQNQSFEKRDYPPMIPYKTQGRGWGLKCLAPIKKGQFVIEYVGEIIDDEEYQRRLQKMHEQKEENYYFLTIDTYRMIDAGPKGNMARFMNHCCQPNCETQKWTVNGDTKVGLFATKDIPADTELTFNYNLECSGKEKKICRCGAPNCSGFIGVKVKQEVEIKKPKKTYRKKEPIKPLALPPCFICKRIGDVRACNNKMCNKAYHLKCLDMTEWPEGNKFACPWHNCNTCSKRTIRCCVKCLNSFCPPHSEGNVRYDHLLGFVCKDHDPSKPRREKMPVRKRHKVINDEMAVSSTTPDDGAYPDSDDIPLALRFQEKINPKNTCSDSDDFEAVSVKHRYRRKKIKKMDPQDSDDDDFEPAKPSATIKFRKMDEDNDHSQDETISSATASDFERDVLRKRKRRKSKKKSQLRKRNKSGPIVGPAVTANENDINNVDSQIPRHTIVDSDRF